MVRDMVRKFAKSEIQPVKTFGTHEQKLKFLQPVAGGEVEGCYGLTEAGAGSDAAALRCKAELKGDKYDFHYQWQCRQVLRSGGNHGSVPRL